jgi:hypothetical protein
MDGTWRSIQLVLTIGIGLLFVLFVGWIVKRRFIDRKPIPSDVANATRAELMELMNADQKAAIEHQMFMEEDDSREDDQEEPR